MHDTPNKMVDDSNVPNDVEPYSVHAPNNSSGMNRKLSQKKEDISCIALEMSELTIDYDRCIIARKVRYAHI